MKVKAIVTENQRFSHPVGPSKDKLVFKTEYKISLDLVLDNKYNAADLPVGKEIEIDLPNPPVASPAPVISTSTPPPLTNTLTK